MIAALQFWTVCLILLIGLEGVIYGVLRILRFYYRVTPLPRTEEEIERYSFGDGVPVDLTDDMTRRGHPSFGYTGKSNDEAATEEKSPQKEASSSTKKGKKS